MRKRGTKQPPRAERIRRRRTVRLLACASVLAKAAIMMPSEVAQAARVRLVSIRPEAERPKEILKRSVDAPNMMAIWRTFIRQ